jgi:AraC-like DNA-binding protein
MAYREFPAPAELAHLVRCVWMRRGTAEEALVLPDGCVDVVVRDGRASVAGPDTGPVPVRLREHEVVIGVRFAPGTAGVALGGPVDELRDRRVALEDLWGRAGRIVGERAGEDPLALARALLPQIGGAAPDPRIRAAAVRLARAPATPVPALAAAVELGERQLRRAFGVAVGYGPKTYARVMRFRVALGLVRAGEPLASAALAAGYADQAHMTREIAALAGRPPGALGA